MSPQLELEKIISAVCQNSGTAEELPTEIHRAILRWMGLNGLVFYQP